MRESTLHNETTHGSVERKVSLRADFRPRLEGVLYFILFNKTLLLNLKQKTETNEQ